jgi:hypothetical protein
MKMKNKSAMRMSRPLNDFQVFKGRCEKTMDTLGGPVMAHHEACLLVRDDQAVSDPKAAAIYAIYKRSENRILQIVRVPEAASLKLAA